MSPVPVSTPSRRVIAWLLLLYALVGCMVVVGGVTRLTGSGLSMVEWRPLMGTLPPLDEAQWQETFAKYQQSPQYQKVNHWMGLDDFKHIFLWEYVHRLLGRLIGVICLVPLVWFLARGELRGRFAWMSIGAFVLGGLQGVLGWFMVKSGLVDMPAVSHLRLAAHLVLAFFVGHYVLWIVLDARRPELAGAPGTRASRRVWALLALITVQIVFGAFMAGTRAGFMYATFPDMNGSWIAPGALAMDPWWRNLWQNPAMIHTAHRWLAWVVVAAAATYAVWALRQPLAAPARRLVLLLFTTVLAQLVLGALTVMLHVQITVAVLHQALAYLLVTVAVVAAHHLR